MNRGYVGYSMSVRAAQAKADGKLTATEFVKWARRWFPGVTTADVREAVGPCEWHHTSKRFNRTDFYDPITLASADVRARLRRRIGSRKLLAKLIRHHGENGQFVLRTHTGNVWYWVTPDDIRSLPRVWLQIEQGLPTGPFSPTPAEEEAALRRAGL